MLYLAYLEPPLKGSLILFTDLATLHCIGHTVINTAQLVKQVQYWTLFQICGLQPTPMEFVVAMMDFSCRSQQGLAYHAMSLALLVLLEMR